MRVNATKCLRYLISLSILLLIFLRLEINVAYIMQNAVNPSFLLYSLLIVIVAIPFIVVNRWKYILQSIGINERFSALYKISHLSQFYGLLLPSSSGFIALKIYFIEKKYPDFRGKAGSTVLIEKTFGFYILCIIGIIGSFFLEGIPNIRLIQLTLLAIFIILMVVIFMLRTDKVSKICNILTNRIKFKFARQILNYIKEMSFAFYQFPLKKAFFNIFVLIILFQLCTIINVYLVFEVFDVNFPFRFHLGILPIIYIISMIPISISGLGIREGFFVYFYGLMGVESSIAFTVSLVNYLILSVTPALIGAFIAMFSDTNLDIIGSNHKGNSG